MHYGHHITYAVFSVAEVWIAALFVTSIGSIRTWNNCCAFNPLPSGTCGCCDGCSGSGWPGCGCGSWPGSWAKEPRCCCCKGNGCGSGVVRWLGAYASSYPVSYENNHRAWITNREVTIQCGEQNNNHDQIVQQQYQHDPVEILTTKSTINNTYNNTIIAVGKRCATKQKRKHQHNQTKDYPQPCTGVQHIDACMHMSDEHVLISYNIWTCVCLVYVVYNRITWRGRGEGRIHILQRHMQSSWSSSKPWNHRRRSQQHTTHTKRQTCAIHITKTHTSIH